MSSNSKNSKSNFFISNKEIWTNNIKQDPKKFTERYSALKETKGTNTITASKNQKKFSQKSKPIKNGNKQKQKNEDYVEDEMDESVAVSIPKINSIATLQPNQSKLNKANNKSFKKQLSNHNPISKSNTFQSKVPTQYYSKHQTF